MDAYFEISYFWTEIVSVVVEVFYFIICED